MFYFITLCHTLSYSVTYCHTISDTFRWHVLETRGQTE